MRRLYPRRGRYPDHNATLDPDAGLARAKGAPQRDRALALVVSARTPFGGQRGWKSKPDGGSDANDNAARERDVCPDPAPHIRAEPAIWPGRLAEESPTLAQRITPWAIDEVVSDRLQGALELGSVFGRFPLPPSNGEGAERIAAALISLVENSPALSYEDGGSSPESVPRAGRP